MLNVNSCVFFTFSVDCLALQNPISYPKIGMQNDELSTGYFRTLIELLTDKSLLLIELVTDIFEHSDELVRCTHKLELSAGHFYKLMDISYWQSYNH